MKEEKLNEKWLKQYLDNYNGKSTEAKAVLGDKKETFNGKEYIPWATMERLTYMQDPNAVFTKIKNENGGLVHTDSFINENYVEGKDGVVSKTSAVVVSHFVRVSLVFLGKEFIEEYPIQDQDYSAAKIYNQNLVNRALQRALAKVASRATGIGLKLYEAKDLQFEETIEDKKPEIKKETKKVETPKVEDTTVELKNVNITTEPVQTTNVVTQEPVKEDVVQTTATTNEYSKEVVELCSLIKGSDKDKMTKILQNINVAVLKQHGFTLSLDDDDNTLCDKLTHFRDVSVFTKAINNMLGA